MQDPSVLSAGQPEEALRDRVDTYVVPVLSSEMTSSTSTRDAFGNCLCGG